MGDRRRSWLASDFVVLVLSETVLVLDGCLICGDTDRRSRRFVAQGASGIGYRFGDSSADVTTGGHAHHGATWDHTRHEALGDTSGHDGGGEFGLGDRMGGGYSLVATSRDVRNYVVRWTQVASADAEQLKARRYHEKSQNTPNKPRPDANRQLLSARSSFPSTNQ
jgi:hypothetical protein